MVWDVIDLLGTAVALGFALTLLVAAWVIPVAAIFGIITIFQKEDTHD